MPMSEQRIRTVCGLDGYEDIWIEYDVSGWGLGMYYNLHADLTKPQVLTEFIPRHSVAWHMENRDGTVIPHPGLHASEAAWAATWKQLDVTTGRTIFNWLTVSVFQAMQEAMALPPKSAGDDKGVGRSAEGDSVGESGSQGSQTG